MRRLFAVLLVVVLGASVSFARQSPSDNTAQQSSDQTEKETKQQEKEARKAKEKEEKQAKKDKKKKEKEEKDKKNGPQDVVNTEVFSQAIANDVLGQVRDGLEGHSSRLMLSAFDEDKMSGYLSFEDQIEAMFQKYDAFRVHYRISNSTIEGNKGVVLVDWEMEEIPKSGGGPQRRNGQIKFEMERNRKGWKITDFNPRAIFS